MSDIRDWRRREEWGRPYEDDPYWNWRGDDRDRRRESRDFHGDGDYGDQRRRWQGGYGRSSAGRGEFSRAEARDWRRRDPDDVEWDRVYGPRDPGWAGRGSMGSNTPGLPWAYGDPWQGAGPGWRDEYQPGGSYGRGPYDRAPYGTRDTYRRPERSWWDRASDEVSSWFGDDQAERRRERDQGTGGYFRGHGPRGYTRSDERIREDISDRLTDNPVLDATDVEVAVSGGEVTLDGHVDSRYSKRLAEDLADEVSGVKHVQNNLRIRDTWHRETVSGVGASMAASGETTTGAKADRPAEKK